MGELAAIEKVTTPNTIETLCRDLSALGLGLGDTVIVHASMSSIGWVCGEQLAVVEALIKTVGADGTIVMPAHTSNNSDPAEWRHPPVPVEWVDIIRETMPAYDVVRTPSRGMGKIAECFRTYPGTLRSDHPHVSFTARGNLAQQIIQKHVLTPFFGMDTPLGKLYNLNAKILLLGVDYSRCTSLHLAEALGGQPEIVKMGCAMYENGTRVWKWFKDYDYDSDDFARIGADYEGTGAVATGKIGCAASKLFHIQPAVDYAAKWIAQNRVADKFDSSENTEE